MTIACGPGEPTAEDLDEVKKFTEFLRDSTSRCAICLTKKEDCDIRHWRTSKKLRKRIFICGVCLPPEPTATPGRGKW